MPGTGGSIRWMMTITVAFVAAVVIVLPLLAAVFFDWRDLRRPPAETAQRATDRMATGLVGPLWDHRIPAVQSALEALRRDPDVAAARVLGGTGTVIGGFGTLPSSPALEGGPFFQSPVLRNGSAIGSVQVLYSEDGLQDRVISGMMIVSIQAVIAMIVIVSVLVWRGGKAKAAAGTQHRVG